MALKKTATKKKATAKKATAKKATARKAAVSAVPGKAIKEPMTKSQMFAHLAETTGVSKKDVTAIFDEYNSLIERHVKKNGAEVFKMPGLFKIKVIKKPARKARKGINPFTGEETMFKAKPASKAVKIQPLKALKDMVG